MRRPVAAAGHNGHVISPVGQHRALPVPDGLEGQRVDQALSRLFGLSRGAAADLADEGRVVVVRRSDIEDAPAFQALVEWLRVHGSPAAR